MKLMSVGTVKMHALVVPVFAFALLSGCTRNDIAPAPPGGTYLSTSAGASFEQAVALEDMPGEYIASFDLGRMFRSEQEPARVYMAAGTKGIVKTENDGNSWSIVNTPLTATTDVVELRNGILMAAGTDGNGQGHIVRSLDNGESWLDAFTVPTPTKSSGTNIIGPSAVSQSVILSLVIDPFVGDRVYAGSNLGSVFVGEQSGKVWRAFTTVEAPSTAIAKSGATVIRRVYASPFVRGQLYVITGEQKLFRITEDGQETIKIPQIIGETNILGGKGSARDIFSVAFIRDFPNALMVGVEDGAVATRDGGETWIDLKVPVETSQSFNSIEVAISPTNISRLFVAINDVLYRSEDGGQTWNTTSLQLPGRAIVNMSINPSQVSRVLVVTQAVKG